MTTTSGGDTNLDLTSPTTNVNATAGGDVNVDSTGAVTGQASGQVIVKPSPRRVYQKPVPAGMVTSVTRVVTILPLLGSYTECE